MTEDKALDNLAEQVEQEQEQPSYIPPEVREVMDYKYRQEALAKIKKAGLPFVAMPSIPDELVTESGNVELPTDMTKLSDEQLGVYYSVFSGLGAYAEGVVAVSDVDFTVADRVALFAERLEILKLPKDLQKNDDLRYGSVNKKKYVRDLRHSSMKEEAVFKVASGVLRSYEKAAASLSREITRRSNSNQYERMESNLDSRRGRR